MKFVLSISILFLCACKQIEGVKCLKVVNNSNKPISAAAELRQDYLCGKYFNKIESNSSITDFQCFVNNGTWEKELTVYDSIHLYIVDFDTFKSLPCDTIFKYNLYKKKVKLNLDSMIKYNWTITYP
jgi:hypothetical protein